MPPRPENKDENGKALGITRRRAMAVSASGAGALTLSSCGDPVTGHYQSLAPRIQDKSGTESPPFAHGVAAGDPGAARIVLWTRLSLAADQLQKTTEVWLNVIGPVEVIGQVEPLNPDIARLPDFTGFDEQQLTEIISASDPDQRLKQVIRTSADRDWTIKADITGLQPGRQYLYFFHYQGHSSPIGRFRTLPMGAVPAIRLAIASCGNWQHGHFNGYHHIANQNFDAVLHLGDYIYEYGADPYTGPDGVPIGRLHEPPHEILSLQDYRTRHAQYKTDPNLQKLHAAHAVIHLWDDHEIANDAWTSGAENHDPASEGGWDARRKAAMQAYYEWMPVREPEFGRPREHLFRSFEFGDLATIVTLETRLMARTAPIEVQDHITLFENDAGVAEFEDRILGADDRQMLGEVQLDWVTETLASAKAKGVIWPMIANQILLTDLRVPDLTPYVTDEDIAAIEPHSEGFRDYVKHSRHNLPLYFDCWSGYPAARERLLGRLAQNGLTDTLVVTGDAHEFWASDVYRESGEKLGVELTTSSITSTTLGDVLGPGTEDFALLITHKNKAARYYNPLVHGYIDLTLTADKGVAKFIKLSTISSADYATAIDASFNLYKENDSIKIRRPRYLGAKRRILFGKS